MAMAKTNYYKLHGLFKELTFHVFWSKHLAKLQKKLKEVMFLAFLCKVFDFTWSSSRASDKEIKEIVIIRCWMKNYSM